MNIVNAKDFPLTINKDLVLRILYSILAGTWSDRNGRKPLFFLPILGQILQSISYLFNYIFMEKMDWRFLYLELIFDLVGGAGSYYNMEYSYMVDITTVAERFGKRFKQICR